MTSLQQQLERLKTPASSALSVEKEHASLLFDRKEAATLDRESVYKIGLTGLTQLTKLDENFSHYEHELFDKTKLNFNRAMIGKEENEKLDESLERMIVYLSPYFNHQACKQVLEWLIYKFQIHRYNAEFLATAFFLYHSTNSYGRLLQILKLTKPEWGWTNEYAKNGLPIPFNILIKQCFSGSGNYYLIGNFSNFLLNAIKLAGHEFAEKHLQSQFTFYASLCASLFEDPIKVNDQLIARVVPSIATALNSKILPFKFAGMMIVCQMVSTTTLSVDILMPILKLILLKMKSSWLEIAMNTAIVICQRQTLATLPTKAIRKLVLRHEELNLNDFLSESMKFYDLTDFLIPFWNTIFEILKDGLNENEFDDLDSVLVNTLNLEYMNDKQASGLFKSLFQFLDESEKKSLAMLKKTHKHIRPIVLRFPSSFEDVRTEWQVRNSELAAKFLIDFGLESYEVNELKIEPTGIKRKRKLSNNALSAVEPKSPVDSSATKKKQLSSLKEAIQRKPFKGSLIDIFELIQDSKSVEKATFALESAVSSDYLKKQPVQEIDEFLLKTVQYVSKNPNLSVLKGLKTLLGQISLPSKLIISLLTPYSLAPDPKKSKQARPLATSLFDKETTTEFGRRLVFVLEILNINKSLIASPELLAKLFDLVDNAIMEKDDAIDYAYIQQLAISLLERFLKDPGEKCLKIVDQFLVTSTWLGKNSARLDSLVKVVRFTNDHSVLRNALRIFASVAPFLTKPVVTQLMSVFAFMGDGGLLKKDNELTLSIIEETLSALFSAIMKMEEPNSTHEPSHQKLLEISRTFGGSLVDIPAHRRVRVLHAFVKTIPADEIWILLSTIFDEFCFKWQRTDSKKQDVEILDDISLELISEFEPEYQIETILNLLDYVVSLGGDSNKSATIKTTFSTKTVIFDRNKRSLQKLRHFRFIIFGWAIKFLSHRPLYEKLSTLTDDEIYARMLKVGKRLLITVANLNDFVDSELAEAEKNEKFERGAEKNSVAAQTLKYWIALAGRADVVADKLRCLLPANVSGHIVCDLLDDTQIDIRLRERALQLLNTKLLQSNMWQYSDMAVHLPYLIKLAVKLNEWIRPAEEKTEILLCQSAAFSLKLLAKRVLTKEIQGIFVETMEKCVVVLNLWSSLDEAMVGSVLVLLGELIRSQNLKGILLHIDPICKLCTNILIYCDQHVEEKKAEKQKEIEDRYSATRRRRTTQSTTGKQYGEEALLVCALTCMQRLLDHLAQFIPSYYEQFMSIFCELSAKFEPSETPKTTITQDQSSQQRHGNVRLRLAQIRQAFAKLELRLLKEPMMNTAKKYIQNPAILRQFVYLLEVILKGSELTDIQKSLPALIELYFTFFKFRKYARTIETVSQFDACDTVVVSSFLVLLSNLSERDLQPIIGRFVIWIESAIKPETKVSERNKLVTIFLFVNKFYDEYTTLALPHFGKLFALLPKLLRGLNMVKPDVPNLALDEPMDSSSSSTNLLFSGDKSSIEGYHSKQLSDLILELVTKTSKV